MSGANGGHDQDSELSVSGGPRAAGGGGEEDAPRPPARLRCRRPAVVDLTEVERRWAPVASSMGGDIVPLDDVLNRLLDGLGTTPGR
jgi:hypothetical protein